MANYCTVDEVKDDIQKTGSEFDAILANTIIPAVSDTIDKMTNRPDGFLADSVASVREYTGDGSDVQWVDENAEVTLVEVKDSPSDTSYETWAAADWIAARGDPLKPDFNGLPRRFIIVSGVGDFSTFTDGTFFRGLRGFTPTSTHSGRGVPTVRITAKWGGSITIPPTVNMAAIAQSSRWLKRGLSAWQDEASSVAFGNLPFKTNKLDPDIRTMLVDARLIRPAIGRRY